MKKAQEDILKAVRQAIQNDDDMALAIKHVPDGKYETDYVTDYEFSVKGFNFDDGQSQDNASLASTIAMDTAMALYGKSKGVDLNQMQIDRLSFETELKVNKMIHNVTKSGDLKNEVN